MENTETYEQEVEVQIENPFATEPKLFNKWSYDNLEVIDPALDNYMAVGTTKSRVFLPHTAGRYQVKKFRKAQCPIIERVIGFIAFKGRNTGKKLKAMRLMRQTLEIIDLMTGRNPIQVIMDAICYASCREDSTRIGKGGNVRRVAVDVSSMRRVSQGIGFIVSFARTKSFKNMKSFSECLAAEFILASKNDPNSSSIKKRDELERGAKANR